jgi:hypothetical protein
MLPVAAVVLHIAVRTQPGCGVHAYPISAREQRHCTSSRMGEAAARLHAQFCRGPRSKCSRGNRTNRGHQGKAQLQEAPENGGRSWPNFSTTSPCEVLRLKGGFTAVVQPAARGPRDVR